MNRWICFVFEITLFMCISDVSIYNIVPYIIHKYEHPALSIIAQLTIHTVPLHFKGACPDAFYIHVCPVWMERHHVIRLIQIMLAPCMRLLFRWKGEIVLYACLDQCIFIRETLYENWTEKLKMDNFDERDLVAVDRKVRQQVILIK